MSGERMRARLVYAWTIVVALLVWAAPVPLAGLSNVIHGAVSRAAPNKPTPASAIRRQLRLMRSDVQLNVGMLEIMRMAMNRIHGMTSAHERNSSLPVISHK